MYDPTPHPGQPAQRDGDAWSYELPLLPGTQSVQVTVEDDDGEAVFREVSIDLGEAMGIGNG